MNRVQKQALLKVCIVIAIIKTIAGYTGTVKVYAGERSQSVYEKYNQASFFVSKNKDLPVINTSDDDTDNKYTDSPVILYVMIGIAAIIIIIMILKKILYRQQSRPRKSRKTDMETPKVEYENSNYGDFAYIKLFDKKGRSLVYKMIIRDRIHIGREKNNEIIISDDVTVSAHHCEIIKRGNLYYISDNNSTNGTFYDGVRVTEETVIMNGGDVRIGKRDFIIEIDTK